MKAIYYLPFDRKATDIQNPNTKYQIDTSIKIFTDNFIPKNMNVLVVPSFNGKEGLESIPEKL